MILFRFLLAGIVLVACADVPQTRAHLDPDTGVTLTVVTRPWVFARERRDVAVNARDYLTLVAAEIDEAGRRRLVLAAHVWSTIDSRATGVTGSERGDLLLVIDGRDLTLAPLASDMALSGARSRALLPPDDAHVTTTLYPVDAAALDYVASGRVVVASFPRAPLALPYTPWSDGRQAVVELLREIGH